MSSGSDTDSSSEISAQDEPSSGIEKPRPSISPLAEGFRSIIEKELIRTRHHSQENRSHADDGEMAADGMSPLPSNVIDELEPDIEPEGPLGYEADVQAIAALLVTKRMQAAAEEREDGELSRNSNRVPSTPRSPQAQQSPRDANEPRQRQLEQPQQQQQSQQLTTKTHSDPKAGPKRAAAPELSAENALPDPSTRPAAAATHQPPQQPTQQPPQQPPLAQPAVVKDATQVPSALIEDTLTAQHEPLGNDLPVSQGRPEVAPVRVVGGEGVQEGAVAPSSTALAAADLEVETRVEAQGPHTAQVTQVNAPDSATEAAEGAQDRATNGELQVQFDEYGFVYDEHGYAYDAQGICRGYFGQDGTFYYYDVQSPEPGEGDQSQQ